MNYIQKVRMERASLAFNNNNRFGFTLIELIVVMGIIALMATIIVPNLRRREPGYERKQFVTYLNSLTQYAWQRAVENHKVHALVFDMSKRMITIQVLSDAKDTLGKKKLVPMKSTYLSSRYEWSQYLIFKNVYVEGKDMLVVDETIDQVWFYIMPDGLAQNVIINMVDKKDRSAGIVGKQLGLVLNPFTLEFKEYDTFQKP